MRLLICIVLLVTLVAGDSSTRGGARQLDVGVPVVSEECCCGCVTCPTKGCIPCEVMDPCGGAAIADPGPTEVTVVDFDEGKLPDNEGAIVEGTVWAKGGVSAKNIKVKLFRRDPVKAVATTKTAANGSYKFVVKGTNDFMGGEFYVKVIIPKGREFTTSKKRPSNVNRKTGRSKDFRVKPGEPVIRNAYIRKPKAPDNEDPPEAPCCCDDPACYPPRPGCLTCDKQVCQQFGTFWCPTDPIDLFGCRWICGDDPIPVTVVIDEGGLPIDPDPTKTTVVDIDEDELPKTKEERKVARKAARKAERKAARKAARKAERRKQAKKEERQKKEAEANP